MADHIETTHAEHMNDVDNIETRLFAVQGVATELSGTFMGSGYCTVRTGAILERIEGILTDLLGDQFERDFRDISATIAAERIAERIACPRHVTCSMMHLSAKLSALADPSRFKRARDGLRFALFCYLNGSITFGEALGSMDCTRKSLI
jgi:hypothetical protein